MNERTPIRAAVVTVSDTRALETDKSGELLVTLLGEIGAIVVERSIVTDETESIRLKLAGLVQSGGIDLVLTTGGTGFAPRDNTPEATRAVIQREAPGIAEAMRRETAKVTPMAMLSSGMSGIAGGTLIINLPGAPKAVAECFHVIRPILAHAVDLVRGKTEHTSEQ